VTGRCWCSASSTASTNRGQCRTGQDLCPGARVRPAVPRAPHPPVLPRPVGLRPQHAGGPEAGTRQWAARYPVPAVGLRRGRDRGAASVGQGLPPPGRVPDGIRGGRKARPYKGRSIFETDRIDSDDQMESLAAVAWGVLALLFLTIAAPAGRPHQRRRPAPPRRKRAPRPWLRRPPLRRRRRQPLLTEGLNGNPGAAGRRPWSWCTCRRASSRWAGNCVIRGFWEGDAPTHVVYLDAFWVDRNRGDERPVRPVRRGRRLHAAHACEWGEPTYGQAAFAGYPVVCVDGQRQRLLFLGGGAAAHGGAVGESSARPDGGLSWETSSRGRGRTTAMPAARSTGRIGRATTATPPRPPAAAFHRRQLLWSIDMAGQRLRVGGRLVRSDVLCGVAGAQPGRPATGTFRGLRAGVAQRAAGAAHNDPRLYGAGHARRQRGVRCATP